MQLYNALERGKHSLYRQVEQAITEQAITRQPHMNYTWITAPPSTTDEGANRSV